MEWMAEEGRVKNDPQVVSDCVCVDILVNSFRVLHDQNTETKLVRGRNYGTLKMTQDELCTVSLDIIIKNTSHKTVLFKDFLYEHSEGQ